GLPTLPFLLLGSSVGFWGWKLRQNSAIGEKAATATAPAPTKENLEALLKVEPLSVEVGLGLVRLVEGGQNSPLLRRIAGIRRQMASVFGYMLPPVRVMVNLPLQSCEYTALLEGAEIDTVELLQI